MHLEDPGDPSLGDYAALSDPALRKRYEHRRGVFIAEGQNPVRELVASGYPVRSLLVAEERVDRARRHARRRRRARLRGPAAVLYELVRFPLHQGVLAAATGPDPPTSTRWCGARRLLVLEGLNDHENLGMLFRSARGLGSDGVLLGPGCADPLYRRSVRVSMGHVLRVPFTRVEAEGADCSPTCTRGRDTVALTPDPAAEDVREVATDLGDARAALVLGAEGPGLSARRSRFPWRSASPCTRGVDSFNVAAAGAIAMHALGPAWLAAWWRHAPVASRARPADQAHR